MTPSGIVTVIAAGIVTGFLAIVLSIGNASLIFAAQFHSYLPALVGLALFSTVVMAVVSVFTSAIPGGVPVVQEVPCVALGVIIARVAQSLPDDISDTDHYLTVMFALGVATLIGGIGIFLLGYFRLGSIIRYVPYSVIGGFLAGTGWLIALGGAGIVLAEPATLDIFLTVPQTAAVQRLGLALVFIAVMTAVRARYANPLAVPAVILAAVVLFVGFAYGSGHSPEDLHASGWLINLPEGGRMWPAVTLPSRAAVDWWAITSGLIEVPLLIVVSAIAFLLNATGIEMECGDDVDLDRELSSVGVMNTIAGVGGGVPGYHSVSATLLSLRLGATSRWVAMVVAVVALAALIFGSVVLHVIPTLVLGGMLLWIGGQLMVEWLIVAYRRLDLADYAIIVLIFLIIVFVGFATGIVVGLIAAVLLFVVQYSRVDVVRHELTGTDYQSAVEAPGERHALLDKHGGSIVIFKLQGFLFFGTADSLRRRAQDHMKSSAADGHGFLVIDFQRVTGVDSATVLSFQRLSQLARRHGFTIVLTGLSPAVKGGLFRGDLQVGEGSPFRIEDDAERGLKWCEDALIAALDNGPPSTKPLVDILVGITGDAGAAGTIAKYCERVDAEPGTKLIEQAAPSEDVFFIESGEAVVEVAGTDDSDRTYLSTVVAGAVVGEIAYYLSERRSASVVATSPVVAWRLSQAAIEQLQQASPDVALAFHRGMATMLSRRLTNTNSLVRFLAE